jgi:hypothetical protein
MKGLCPGEDPRMSVSEAITERPRRVGEFQFTGFDRALRFPSNQGYGHETPGGASSEGRGLVESFGRERATEDGARSSLRKSSSTAECLHDPR